MLLKRKKEKKAAKTARLYSQYSKLMYKTAYNILQDEQLAENAIHEAFERVIKNLHKINEENCPQTRNYLVIIIRNLALDMVKKKTPLIVSCEEVLSETAYDNNPLDIVLRKETASELQEAIEALKPIYRDVFIMRVARGHSIAEISELLNINAETVKKRLTRAKKMIAQNMERRDNNEKGN